LLVTQNICKAFFCKYDYNEGNLRINIKVLLVLQC
jgi:hypothetical protein